MATYRKVFVDTWRDKSFEGYSPQAKLVFLYLITNPHIGESGLFEITPKTISHDTGIDTAKVESIIGGQLKNVFYDSETSTLFVAKFRLYNQGGRPDLIVKAIRKERSLLVSPLWEVFDSLYDVNDNSISFKGDLNCLSRVGQPFANGSYKDNNNPNPNSKDKKEHPLLLIWREFPNLAGNSRGVKQTPEVLLACRYRAERSTAEDVRAVLSWYSRELNNPLSFWGGKNNKAAPIKFPLTRVYKGSMKSGESVFDYFMAQADITKPIEDPYRMPDGSRRFIPIKGWHREELPDGDFKMVKDD